jgi:threonine dehydratase
VDVEENDVVRAWVRVMQISHTLPDAKAAAAVAAFLVGGVKICEGEKGVAILSGGNVDETVFDVLVNYALGLMGHNFSLALNIPDSTSSFEKVLKILRDAEISVTPPPSPLTAQVVDARMDRMAPYVNVHQVRLSVQVPPPPSEF